MSLFEDLVAAVSKTFGGNWGSQDQQGTGTKPATTQGNQQQGAKRQATQQQDNQKQLSPFAAAIAAVQKAGVVPQQKDQEVSWQQPIQQGQQYNTPRIAEQQRENKPAQENQEQKKEEDKKDRKRLNDVAANALKGMLIGGASSFLSPDEAEGKEPEQPETELKPDVETENSQNNEAKGIGARIREAEKNPEKAKKTADKENTNEVVNSIIDAMYTPDGGGPTPEAPFSVDSQPVISPDDVAKYELGNEMTDEQIEEYYRTMFDDPYAALSIRGPVSPFGEMSSEDIKRLQDPDANMSNEVKQTLNYFNYPEIKGKEVQPSDTWFTDAYGYLTTLPYDGSKTWDEMTNGTGYMRTSDGKWYDEDFNLYDENPNPEGKTKEERQQDAVEDEMKAMSKAQAYLLENPGATMGGHKVGDQTINELMSEVGNNGEGYLKNEERPELGSYTADDLESMSDIVLYDLALRNPDFQKYMTDTYGAGYGNVNAFFDQYLNADNGEDKEAITRDIFLGNDAFELDPVLQAQLMQRVYNGNADLANMNPEEQGDEIVKAIMDQYGFNNPLDVALWGSDEGYQNENALTYDREAALLGTMFANMMDGYGGKLSDIGLSPEDVALYAAIGNSDIRGNAFDDRYNGLLSGYNQDEFLDLLGLSGYKDEFKKINFNNDNTDGKGKYTYRDWKDPGRNWSMASLYDAAAQAQTPEELEQLLGVEYNDAANDPVFSDAADRLFDRGWQHGYKYGARRPQAEG